MRLVRSVVVTRISAWQVSHDHNRDRDSDSSLPLCLPRGAVRICENISFSVRCGDDFCISWKVFMEPYGKFVSREISVPLQKNVEDVSKTL